MSTLERQRLRDAYLAAWNSHDPDAVASFFATDAVYDDRGAAEVARGRAAIRGHVATVMAAFPDMRFEYVRTFYGDGFIGAEWTAQMTHRGELFGLAATGRRVGAAGVDIAVLAEDGLVTHLVSHYDAATMMRDLRLLPQRGSRLERTLLRAASLTRRRA
jgi:steroid delta-isomerase-like uncharacterized protein